MKFKLYIDGTFVDYFWSKEDLDLYLQSVRALCATEESSVTTYEDAALITKIYIKLK